MKKRIILSLLTITYLTVSAITVSAQISFEQKLPIAPAPPLLQEFEGIFGDLGSMQFADIDNDNDQDLLISGENINTLVYESGTKLFLNDGNGSFTLAPNINPFNSITGRLKVADFDNDGLLDIIICGKNTNDLKVTELYKNVNGGNFTLVSGTPFEGAYLGGLDVADIDGDNDVDILYTGYNNNSNTKITRLYRNNGALTFTQVSGPFANFAKGECQFADIDDDNDQDVLITGVTGGFETTTTLIYKNDGTGTFSSQGASGVANLFYSNIDFGDVDNDNDLDLIVSGITSTSNYIAYTKLYLNNGTGNFTLSASNPFSQLSYGNLDLIDIDNDNDLDVFILGQSTDQLYIAQLYLNDANGSFTQNTTPNIQEAIFGTCALADVNNDNYPDVLINAQSYNNSNNTTSGRSFNMLYLNDGAYGFKHASGSTMPGLIYASISTGDIDNDGDQDLFMFGRTNLYGISSTTMYKNDGNGNFTPDATFNCPGIPNGSACFVDIENDNDLDLIVLGVITESHARVYLNDGAGNFTLTNSPTINNLSWSTIQSFDFDNDGDQDLIATGKTGLPSGTVEQVARFYRNDGGAFTYLYVQDNAFNLTSCHQVSIADIDGDDDLDLYAYDEMDDGIYFNDGDGNFTSSGTNPIMNLYGGQSVLGDIDGDTDPDLIVTGIMSGTGVYHTKVYKNNGAGTFTAVNSTIPGIFEGSLQLVDIDLDTDLDLFVTGRINENLNCISDLYLNSGTGVFTLHNTAEITNTITSQARFSHLNNDQYPDLILVGKPEKIDVNVANIYINNSCFYYSTETVTTCDSYNWIDGNTYTSSTNTPSWTLSSTSGCDSIVTLNLVINSSPVATATNNGDATITANGAGNYQWINCNTNTEVIGATNSTFEPVVNGSYAVVVSNGNCSDTSNCVVINNVSLQEFGNLNITIAPNPTNDLITILFEENSAQLTIYDAQGKLVKQSEEIETGNQVSLHHLLTGIYFFELVTSEGKAVKRIVKQ